MKTLRFVALVASLVAPAANLAAQSVTARAVIAAPRSSVGLGGVTERVNGVWGGVALDLHAGPFMISGSGMRGQLTPPSSAPVLEREVGELAAKGAYQVRPWLEFQFGYATRAFSSAAGLQTWKFWRGSGTLSRDLGLPDVRTHVAFAYLPVVNVTGQARRMSGWGTDVGISVAPERAPVFCELGYRIERFNFPRTAGRSEQFETLTLSVGVRVRRLGGRWRVREGS